MRRFTRSTNAFSKKVETLAHAVALHFMRVHKTLGTTPEVAARGSCPAIIALLADGASGDPSLAISHRLWPGYRRGQALRDKLPLYNRPLGVVTA